MTVQTPPWPPVLSAQTYRLRSNTGLFISPLTGKMQGVARKGARWEFDVGFNILDDTRAAQWRAFLADCQDQFNPFYWSFYPKGLPAAYTTGWDVGTPAWGATPLINGASQTGRSVIVDGLAAGATFKAGDGIAFDNPTYRELHQITADTTANGSGQATFPIVPPIRKSPVDNAAVYFDGNTATIGHRAACEVIVATPDQAAASLQGFQTTMSFKLIEFVR